MSYSNNQNLFSECNKQIKIAGANYITYVVINDLILPLRLFHLQTDTNTHGNYFILINIRFELLRLTVQALS
jgi:hypothetical protein